LKDSQHDMDALTLARDEAIISAKEADKRCKSSEAELLQLQSDLASSERARKMTQSERDDLLDELNSGSSARLATACCVLFNIFIRHFKGIRFSTYMALQAAYAASAKLCVTDRAGVHLGPSPCLTDFCLQPYSHT